MKKLIVLTADLDMENAVKGILSRKHSIGADIDVQQDVGFVRHLHHDPACYQNGPEFLSVSRGDFENALIVFDHEGSGQDAVQADKVEEDVERRMRVAGWKNCAAIVIDPELESWVWCPSPKVDEQLGWKGRSPSLREWLVEKHWLKSGEVRPKRPKEAMEAALREVRKPRSARIYEELAKSVSLAHCNDRAFLKLKNSLLSWFPFKAVGE